MASTQTNRSQNDALLRTTRLAFSVGLHCPFDEFYDLMMKALWYPLAHCDGHCDFVRRSAIFMFGMPCSLEQGYIWVLEECLCTAWCYTLLCTLWTLGSFSMVSSALLLGVAGGVRTGVTGFRFSWACEDTVSYEWYWTKTWLGLWSWWCWGILIATSPTLKIYFVIIWYSATQLSWFLSLTIDWDTTSVFTAMSCLQSLI